MRVYLVSAYATRDSLRAYADELSRIGMVCTSRWLNDETPISAGTIGAATSIADAQVRKHVLDDFEDIHSANVLILFTESATGQRGGGGRHVETGYALAKGKKVVVIGKPENVFHRGSPQCTVVSDWHEAVLTLVAMRNTEPQAK